jgi:diacylglycerol O-acyltransferase/trehalose O-mycolyltransferase
MPGSGRGSERARRGRSGTWGGRLVGLLVLLTVALVACAGPGGSSRGPQAAHQPGQPARVVAVQTLGPRLRDLTIDSPALSRRAKVRLLLPRRYADEPGRRWPVLWLLHGCCDSYQSWTRSTDVGRLPRLDDVRVVMPEAGPVGCYSDWYNDGPCGPPPLETIHKTYLRQLIHSHRLACEKTVFAA